MPLRKSIRLSRPVPLSRPMPLSKPIPSYKLMLGLLLLLLSFSLNGQQTPFFGPVSLGQSTDEVWQFLKDQPGTTTIYAPGSVQFPLARNAEEHWVIEDYRLDQGMLDRMVLTFADGALVFIQAQGGVNARRKNLADSSYKTYNDFQFDMEGGVVLLAAEDTGWMLNDAGRHLNLFAWDHPLLSGTSMPEYGRAVDVPDYLQMGASLDELEPLLKAASQRIYVQELDGSDPNADLQWDCFGIEYGGFSRKAEARFGKGQLNTVWILTAKEEESRLRESLQKTYGPPIFTSDDWEAFHNWQVFLRKDKPEILFLTEALGRFYKKEFFGQ